MVFRGRDKKGKEEDQRKRKRSGGQRIEKRRKAKNKEEKKKSLAGGLGHSQRIHSNSESSSPQRRLSRLSFSKPVESALFVNVIGRRKRFFFFPFLFFLLLLSLFCSFSPPPKKLKKKLPHRILSVVYCGSSHVALLTTSSLRTLRVAASRLTTCVRSSRSDGSVRAAAIRYTLSSLLHAGFL